VDLNRLWIAFLAAQVPDARFERPAPLQPLPFSHKTHAAAALTCKQCHPVADPGDAAGLPATKVCLACHVAVKKDSPHIAKLARWHKENKAVPWARVYQIPQYVAFSHQRHLAVDGVQCETCHGPVATREVLRREKETGMQACMDCHRARGASNDCLLCHEQR
jgi:hypothetical protein